MVPASFQSAVKRLISQADAGGCDLGCPLAEPMLTWS